MPGATCPDAHHHTPPPTTTIPTAAGVPQPALEEGVLDAAGGAGGAGRGGAAARRRLGLGLRGRASTALQISTVEYSQTLPFSGRRIIFCSAHDLRGNEPHAAAAAARGGQQPLRTSAHARLKALPFTLHTPCCCFCLALDWGLLGKGLVVNAANCSAAAREEDGQAAAAAAAGLRAAGASARCLWGADGRLKLLRLPGACGRASGGGRLARLAGAAALPACFSSPAHPRARPTFPCLPRHLPAHPRLPQRPLRPRLRRSAPERSPRRPPGSSQQQRRRPASRSEGAPCTPCFSCTRRCHRRRRRCRPPSRPLPSAPCAARKGSLP